MNKEDYKVYSDKMRKSIDAVNADFASVRAGRANAQVLDRITVVLWKSGVQIVLFIAGLQSIPSSLYEVAKIEGATGYETFWKVTFPMVMPHIITCTIYTIVDAFSKSEVVKLAYSTAFTESRYGLSSAFSVVSTCRNAAIVR